MIHQIQSALYKSILQQLMLIIIAPVASYCMDALVALGITNYALWIVRNTRSALFTKDGCTVCKAAMKVLKRLGELNQYIRN